MFRHCGKLDRASPDTRQTCIEPGLQVKRAPAAVETQRQRREWPKVRAGAASISVITLCSGCVPVVSEDFLLRGRQLPFDGMSENRPPNLPRIDEDEAQGACHQLSSPAW